jgi:hypothetical protein
MRRNSHTTRMLLAAIAIILAVAPSTTAKSKYEVVYNFKGGTDGIFPVGQLAFDSSGNLYGATSGGGLGVCDYWGGCGTIFELTPTKSRWAGKILYRFLGGPDGGFPNGSLVFDKHGNLFGTTSSGGQGDCSGRGCGTVFELKRSSSGRWTESILYRFAGGDDGEIPNSGLIFDTSGNLYGTTEDGGNTSCHCGTVFELMPQTDGSWNEKILYSFSGPDGADPNCLVFDSEGNLYGVGGVGGYYGVGVAYELSPTSSGTWNESILYNFSSDGMAPGGDLIFKGRNLYGATVLGGPGNWGTIFELKHESNGSWTHSVLYDFNGKKDGRYPIGSLIFDKSGNLYGAGGGDVSCTKGDRWGCGNIFVLKPLSGGNWKQQVLHTFTGSSHGGLPGAPVFDKNGNLAGVTYWGGNCKNGFGEYCGLAFELTP